MNNPNPKKKKEKKKGRLGRFVFVAAFAALGFFGGQTLTLNLPDSDNFGVFLMGIGWLLLSLYAGVFLHIILHELGHLVFGQLSGYRFISFRVGSLMLVKEDNRLHFKKYAVVGTGGQCLMLPPEEENCPVVLYHLGGSLFNFIFAELFYLLYLVLPSFWIWDNFLWISAVSGVLMGLTNAIPLRMGGIANDGYNLVAIKKSKEAAHAVWLLLTVNARLAQGERITDMPAEWFTPGENPDLSNPLTCGLSMVWVSYLHTRQDFAKAAQESRYLLENASGMLELHRNELRCELLFYELMDQQRQSEIEALYTKPLKKYIKATESYVARCRLQYALALLWEKDPAKADKALAQFEKVAKTYPYRGEVESERELLPLIAAKSREVQA